MTRADGFTAFLLDVLAPLGPMSARRMFGGTGIWHGPQMFALIVREELFLKVGDANRAAFEERGQEPFSYETKNGRNTIGSYWSCPPELLDDPDELRAWARQSVAVALAAAARAQPKRKRTKAAPRR